MKFLKFIHITKTGGVSIENIGLENNIFWGQFHTKYYINKIDGYKRNWYHYVFEGISDKIKLKYDWFTVVRNPYTRILSQFHYDIIKERFINNYKLEDYDKTKFNEHIRYNINNRKKHLGHYMEQYKYIDKKYKIHILKFENLEEDFNNLMKKYNLNLSLSQHLNTSIKIFNISNFDFETISLINQIYKKNFDFFGYEMIKV